MRSLLKFIVLIIVTCMLSFSTLWADVVESKVNNEWEKLNAAELADLARSTTTDQGTTDKVMLAKYVADRYLKLVAKNTVSQIEWLDVMAFVGDSITSDQQVLIRTDIRRALLSDVDDLSFLSDDMLFRVSKALASLGYADTEIFCVKWAVTSDLLLEASVHNLADMVRSIQASLRDPDISAEAREAQSRLALVVDKRCFSDVEALRELSPKEVLAFCWGLEQVISKDQRANWAAKIRAAHDFDLLARKEDGCADLVFLCSSLTYLGSSDGKMLMEKVILESDAWQSLSPGKLAIAAQILTSSRSVGSNLGSERLAEVIMNKYMREPASSKAVGINVWSRLAYYVVRKAARTYSQEWASCLRNAYVNDDETFMSLTPGDVSLLYHTLYHLEGANPDALLESYIAKSNAWKSNMGAGLRELVRKMEGSEAKLTDSWLTITAYVSETLQNDNDTFKHLWGMIRPLSNLISPQQKMQWASRLVAVDAGSPDSLMVLTEKEVVSFQKVLEYLNMKDLGDSLFDEWHRRQCPVLTDEEADLSSAFWWRVCLLRSMTTPASKIDSTLKLCMEDLAAQAMPFPKTDISHLRAVQESHPASFGTLLERILDYGVEGAQAQEDILNVLSVYCIEAAKSKLSGEVAGLIDEAMGLESSDPMEAITKYSRAIEQTTTDNQLRRMLSWRALRLAAAHTKRQIPDVSVCLANLGVDKGYYSPSTFDFATRLLVRKVRVLPDAERREAWLAGIAALRAEGGFLLPATLQEIDTLVETIYSSGSLHPIDILTDILCLVPDLETMCEIQSRRVTAYANACDQGNAMRAARMNVVMAVGLSQGPRDAIRQMDEINDSSGAAASTWSFLEPVSENASEADFNVDSGAAMPLDDALLQAAATALQTMVKTEDARVSGYLAIFSGNTQGGVCSLLDAIQSVPNHSYKLHKALADVSVGISMNTCSFNCRQQYLRDVALGNPVSIGLSVNGIAPQTSVDVKFRDSMQGAYTPLNRKLASDLMSAPLSWGRGCLMSKDMTGSELFFRLALDGAASDEKKQLIERIAAITSQSAGSDSVSGLLQNVASEVLDLETKALLLTRVCDILFAQKQYAECVKASDELAGLTAEGFSMDPQLQLNRAVSLIRLGQTDKAMEILISVEGQNCSPEQRAKAAFLSGYLHMQAGYKDEARQAFQRTVTNYSGTTSAVRASRILAKLGTQ